MTAVANHTPERETELDTAMAQLLRARERGETEDRPSWLARYPELADFFQSEEELGTVLEPLREVFRVPTPTERGAPVPPAIGDSIAFVDGTLELPAEGDGPIHPAIEGYEILAQLGRGGMGIVYKARDVRLDRIEALKVLLPGTPMSEQLRLRLQEEAKLVARLDHPGIVRLYLLGDYRGWPYLRLEYVEGGTLADHLRRGPLSSKDAAALVEQLARAVQYAHSQGVIHRDLKPSNVLLASGSLAASPAPNDSGERRISVARITDFGLARDLRRGVRLSLTLPGAIMGTAGYLAPEQAETAEVGPAADIYGLGAILYECLTGRPPFAEGTVIETILKSLVEDPVPPGTIEPSIDPTVAAICLRCLEKDPSRRWASAGQLADSLAALRRRPRRWTWLALAAGVVVLTLLGLALWLRPYREPSSKTPLPEPVGPVALYRTLANDLEGSPQSERSRLRYLTLTHTRGQPESRSESVRVGLEELARWWSGPEGEVQFRAVDTDRTIYRFDLTRVSPAPGEFWEAVLRADPYALDHRDSDVHDLRTAAQKVARLAEVDVAHVRADWFLTQVGRLAQDKKVSMHRGKRPWPARLSDMARQYENATLTLEEASLEIGLPDAQPLRQLLEIDNSVWSVALRPLARGQKLSRRTWESWEALGQKVSPAQYVSCELGLGIPSPTR